LFNLGVENLEKSSRETRSRGYPQLVDRWPTGAARRMATRIGRTNDEKYGSETSSRQLTQHSLLKSLII